MNTVRGGKEIAESFVKKVRALRLSRLLEDVTPTWTACYAVTGGAKRPVLGFVSENAVLVRGVWPRPYESVRFSDIERIIVREEPVQQQYVYGSSIT